MPSLKQNFVENLQFDSNQMASLRSIGRYRGKQELFYQQVPEALKTLQNHAIIESSESSNRIEGIVAPHERIKALVVKHSAPKNRSEQEIAGYRDALAMVHESYEHIEISTNFILQLHSILHRYMSFDGGKWKKSENEIVERNAAGEVTKVRFKPVKALQTPAAMETLINEYRARIDEGHEPLILVPLFVLDFLSIHPFSDGNGRMSRLLTLLLLYKSGYEVGRYISLERIIEGSKETYYEVLESCSQNWHGSKHTASPWLNYFWGFLLRAYKEFESKTGQITLGKGSKRSHVKEVIENWNGLFSLSDIEKASPMVSREMVRLVMKEMKEEKSIEPTGKGRYAKWKKVK